MDDLPVAGLRVLREVAELGSLTAAAGVLGYTQSAVSRQLATLEAAAGCALVTRGRAGAKLTPAGGRLLLRAERIFAELELARRELDERSAPVRPVRLGAFAAAGAALVPRALASVAARHPEIEVRHREATTPALVRALRARTLDLAVLGATPPFRPFDDEAPALVLTVVGESELLIGVGPGHPLAPRTAVDLAELEGEAWIASHSEGPEQLLGIWPGLPGRPRVAATVRDWLAKLQLVAAGVGITTVPAIATAAVPPSISLLSVRDGPREQRRTVLAYLPDPPTRAAVLIVADALRAAVPLAQAR